MRKLEGEKTLLSRQMHAIAYDEIHDEFFVALPFPQAILAFRGAADGEEAPIRIIQGPKTKMEAPDRLAVDPVNNEIFIPQDDAVLVFPRGANGDVAPIRMLHGPNTQLGANAVAVDPINNLLVVIGNLPGGRREGSTRIFIFGRTYQGDVKPKAIIGGPKSGFKNLSGPFTLYPPRGWIIAGDRGFREGEPMIAPDSYIGVWSIKDNGDVPPRWRIGGPYGVFQMPRGVTLNPKNKEIIATDKRLNAVLTFYFPEIF